MKFYRIGKKVFNGVVFYKIKEFIGINCTCTRQSYYAVDNKRDSGGSLGYIIPVIFYDRSSRKWREDIRYVSKNAYEEVII